MTNNLEKELEMYFYNKGYGSESGKEAADMTAFLQEHEKKETNLFNNITYQQNNDHSLYFTFICWSWNWYFLPLFLCYCSIKNSG